MAGLIPELSHWIVTNPYGQFVRYERVAFPMFIPFALVLHLGGIAAIVGASLLTGFRLLRICGTDMPTREVARRMLPWIWYALPVMVVTGYTVLTNRPGRYLRNPDFGLKMVLLLAALTLTFTLQRWLTRNDVAESSTTRVAGAALIFLWLATLFAGRWIPYAI
jgi:hypothetical protein